jgi:hypothetical protein
MKTVRDTATHSNREIVRRVSYLLYIATAIGGVGWLVAAAVNRNFAYACVAAVAVVSNLMLHHLGRRRLNFDGLKNEIRGHPFSGADRVDREDDETRN